MRSIRQAIRLQTHALSAMALAALAACAPDGGDDVASLARSLVDPDGRITAEQTSQDPSERVRITFVSRSERSAIIAHATRACHAANWRPGSDATSLGCHRMGASILVRIVEAGGARQVTITGSSSD